MQNVAGRTGIALLGLLALGGVSAQTVGVSWSNFQEERWRTDEAAIQGRLEELGGEYLSADAQSSPEKQLSDIDALITRELSDRVEGLEDEGPRR